MTKNRYSYLSHNLLFTEPEIKSYNQQISYWRDYFQKPELNRGLSNTTITDQEELRQLTSFFAWAAWATTANIPGKSYSYPNNFPYEPLIGNGPSIATILWSALSLITLLGGIALILLFLVDLNILAGRRKNLLPPHLVPGNPTAIERASIKFFVVAMFLLLLQTFAGGALAHYFADPKGFFGFDLSAIFHQMSCVPGIYNQGSSGLLQHMLAEVYSFPLVIQKET